jgi:Xaa-Pro aminopeptidase
VYGLDYIMTVRDFRALAEGGIELRPYDVEFDLARAVKSEAELRSVRRSMAINEEGFWVLLEAYATGRTEAEIMAPAAARFVELGTARHAMNMVLSGSDGRAGPEFKAPSDSRPVGPDDVLLYSLEIAAWGGHWVEFSRPIIAGTPSAETRQMMQAYEEYGAIARETMREGATAAQVHHAVSAPFRERGFTLGHVTGHSIGMTMIEHPRIGAASDVVLRENMVLSMHPHVISPDGATCLYMQDTFRVGATAGEPLSDVPLALFDGSERRG